MIRIDLEVFRIFRREIIMRLENASHLSAPAYGAMLQVALSESALNIVQRANLAAKIDRFDEIMHAKM